MSDNEGVSKFAPVGADLAPLMRRLHSGLVLRHAWQAWISTWWTEVGVRQFSTSVAQRECPNDKDRNSVQPPWPHHLSSVRSRDLEVVRMPGPRSSSSHTGQDSSRAQSTALVEVDPRLLAGAYIRATNRLWLVVGYEEQDDGSVIMDHIVLEDCIGTPVGNGTYHKRITMRASKILKHWTLERAPMSADDAQRLDDEITELLAKASDRAARKVCV